MEIADALSHAHEHGVTHRDLKSTNVMITPKRGAKVLDFGLARMLDTHQIDALSQSQRSLTGEGMIAGTLPYMAPELLRGQRGDQRTDIWALGVLLYEMVSGRRPFTGATGFEVSAGILQQEPPALPSTVPAADARDHSALPREESGQAISGRGGRASGSGRNEGLRVFPCSGFRPSRGVAWRNTLLLVAGLAIAAVAWFVIQSPRVGNLVSNVRDIRCSKKAGSTRRSNSFRAWRTQSPNEANAWDSLGEGYLANGMAGQMRSKRTRGRSRSIRPSMPRILGRGLALAALGRYDEALERTSPISGSRRSVVPGWPLPRGGGGARQRARGDDDAEVNANALLTSAWLQIEQKQYARALDEVRAAQKALAERQGHSLLVLADLIGGVAETSRRRHEKCGVASRFAEVPSRQRRIPSNRSGWPRSKGRSRSRRTSRCRRTSFKAAQKKVWQTLGHDASTVFATNLPSRDGLARVELARGNRAAAIAGYKRLTATGPARGTSAVFEPRDVLQLARLLDAHGDKAAARVEYERFLKLWANADAGLPEVSEAKTAAAAVPPR